MAVKIKLSRMGRKKLPSYRIVVAQERSKINGRVIDTLGFYDPVSVPPKIKVNDSSLQKWLKFGVQPTNAVKKLLKI